MFAEITEMVYKYSACCNFTCFIPIKIVIAPASRSDNGNVSNFSCAFYVALSTVYLLPFPCGTRR